MKTVTLPAGLLAFLLVILQPGLTAHAEDLEETVQSVPSASDEQAWQRIRVYASRDAGPTHAGIHQLFVSKSA